MSDEWSGYEQCALCGEDFEADWGVDSGYRLFEEGWFFVCGECREDAW